MPIPFDALADRRLLLRSARLVPVPWSMLLSRRRSSRVVAADTWLLLQQTAAAAVAWLIATRVAQHHIPFFAPIAAVVALNTSLGYRGANAVRLLVGVVIGIVFGEIAVRTIEAPTVALAVATLLAMVCAQALDPARVVIAQAASAAILTVATTTGEPGTQRLLDALIGAGVALVFSQLLFSPDPVGLVRRAEAAALTVMADGLRLTAGGAEARDPELARQGLERLSEVRDALATLAEARTASGRVVRRSVLWRRRKTAAATEAENAAHLDLLGASCLLLARSVIASEIVVAGLAQPIRDLADLLADLAQAPGDAATRTRAVDGAKQLAASDASGPTTVIPPMAALSAAAADVVTFAGRRPT